MTEITNSGRIIHSFGDNLPIRLNVNRPLEANEKLIFAVKRNGKVMLQKDVEIKADGEYFIILSSDEIKDLTVGEYIYDVTLKTGGNYFTTIWARGLEIKEVAHNV